MRILLANEARAGGGGVETYLSTLTAALIAHGHDVALLYGNAEAESGPVTIETAESWSVTDDGLDRAVAGVREWRPDVCFSHNMRRLDVDERLCADWPTFKMMHGYFGTCVSGHKAFSFPAVEPCPRTCGPACLAYFLPRRCGQLRPDLMLSQYAWARRQQRLFGRYAGVIVASGHMRREYLRHHVPPARVHAIPLFAAPWHAPAPPSGSTIDVLFLGRMTPLKGGTALLHAAHHAAALLHRPVRLVLAGAGPERTHLEREASALGRDGSIVAEFPGWVDAAGRSALLSRATVVAIPSIWPEPFGLVGLEAGHAGVPAVAFDVGGISDWLTHDVNGRLADPRGGPIAFADALCPVLADPSVRARLSAGARATALRLSADAHVAVLEAVLRGQVAA